MTKSTKADPKIELLLEDLLILEDYIHDLFNFSPLPICFVSPIGVILEANPALEQMVGLRTEEIIGESAERFFEEEEFRELTERTISEEIVEGREMVFLPKSKKGKAVQVFTKARKDEKGEIVGFFIGLFDLTGIKSAETDLKEAQTALLNILEDTEEARQRAEAEKNKTLAIIMNFSDGILVFDKEHRLILTNPRAETLLGSDLKKFIGEPVNTFLKEKLLASLAIILGREIKQFSRKELVASEDLVLEVSSVNIQGEQADLGNLIILHDITREKMVERLKTEFVSISAHQLRTPLSAIKWTLRMILDGDLGEVSAEQREFLEKTYRSNERMIILVNSLLNVTRIEEGRFVYKPTMASLERIVELALKNFEDEFKKRRLAVGFKKPKPSLPEILIDEEKIALVIQNLIENAIKYTPTGGKIVINLEKKEKMIFFEIKDTGVGIPQKQQERVFSKFFRGTNVIRLETEGTGLGLFIVKNIIEAHGGRVGFESGENKGSTFYFTLPVKKELDEFLEEP